MSEYIKKEDLIRKLNAWDIKAHGIPNYAWRVINELPTYSFPEREKGEWNYKNVEEWANEHNIVLVSDEWYEKAHSALSADRVRSY